MPPASASGLGSAPAGVHEVFWCCGAGLSPPVGTGRLGGFPLAHGCGEGRCGGAGQALGRSRHRRGTLCSWLGSVLAPSYHLSANQPHVFLDLPLSHPLSMALSIFPPTPGSGHGPNPVYAVSVLLSQYFLVRSHPVSVWSALTPASQNRTFLLSLWPFCTLLSQTWSITTESKGVGEVLFSIQPAFWRP